MLVMLVTTHCITMHFRRICLGSAYSTVQVSFSKILKAHYSYSIFICIYYDNCSVFIKNMKKQVQLGLADLQ